MPRTTIAIRWRFPATDESQNIMTLFRNVVFVAAIAGLLAGIVMTAMQAYTTVPLILKAETFEGAEAPAHDHAAQADAAGTSTEAATPAAHRLTLSPSHGRTAWSRTRLPARRTPLS